MMGSRKMRMARGLEEEEEEEKQERQWNSRKIKEVQEY